MGISPSQARPGNERPGSSPAYRRTAGDRDRGQAAAAPRPRRRVLTRSPLERWPPRRGDRGAPLHGGDAAERGERPSTGPTSPTRPTATGCWSPSAGARRTRRARRRTSPVRGRAVSPAPGPCGPPRPRCRRTASRRSRRRRWGCGLASELTSRGASTTDVMPRRELEDEPDGGAPTSAGGNRGARGRYGCRLAADPHAGWDQRLSVPSSPVRIW